MCGIFGFSNTTRITQLMTPTLAIAMEQRGGDAWGVTDGTFIWKDPTSICDTFVDCELDGPSYHTRARSVGANSERNTHPFHFEGTHAVVTGMHNGHISNHMEIGRKYDRKYEVDSEHIFANIADKKPVADLFGYGAVVWYEHPVGHPEKMRRYFSRWNTEALHFAALETGEVVYASTKEAIKCAAVFAGADIKFFWDTEQNKRYFLKEVEKGRWKLFKDLTLPWGQKPVEFCTVNNSPLGLVGARVNSSHNADWDCPIHSCINGKITSKEMLICDACFERFSKKVYGAGA